MQAKIQEPQSHKCQEPIGACKNCINIVCLECVYLHFEHMIEVKTKS